VNVTFRTVPCHFVPYRDTSIVIVIVTVTVIATVTVIVMK
jgi:hypothetical protein